MPTSNEVSRSRLAKLELRRAASFGVRRRRIAQRIEVRLEVADRAVGGDQVVDVRLLEAVDDRGAAAPCALEGAR